MGTNEVADGCGYPGCDAATHAYGVGGQPLCERHAEVEYAAADGSHIVRGGVACCPPPAGRVRPRVPSQRPR